MLYTQPQTQNRMLFSHKNNEMLPFAITQINLEGVMISEIHQRKTNTVCYYLCGLKKIQLINITKKNPDSQIQKTKQWLPVVRGKWGEAIQE